MYNLTVDGVHTYYVHARATPVLVHNCNGATDWVPGRPGTDHTPQGSLPKDAGIKPGEALESGEYHYVVNRDGSLRAMRDDDMWAMNPDAGHTSLGNGEPVHMAGTFEVNSAGEIVKFDNFSGHYRPEMRLQQELLEDIARVAFTNHGLPAPARGAWNPFEYRR